MAGIEKVILNNYIAEMKQILVITNVKLGQALCFYK